MGKNGNVGNANSGRKPKSVEFAEMLNMGLANYIHNDELVKLKDKDIRTLDEMKVLVTPITVKGIKETSEVNLKVGGIDLENFVDYATKTNKSIPQDKVDAEKSEDSTGRD
jgi:hypothetical protein